ncbi:ABC transporter ATP-binding protein [Pedobacter punctiformis]|uniref:ABC transporter ATP-binding protein n=1 Tax=Pedobacter punctiformis TaxID=3004097 RepID=A0ABT4L7R7_9SPHI|nr:ABC transporter ATP-binding protein [Pedobacter sp. HCMS5-2]MCZ4243968.1 ABC transporter ATP-binding protein [Pedobacter sp. HCMS5-2]
MIKVESLNHRYNNGPILHFPDWTIGDNEQWLLLGSSGSGKSTLLNCISGLLKPTQGNIVLNGTDLYSLSSKAMDRFRGQHIGIVFQKPHLIQSLNISENIEIACSFAGLPVIKSKIFSLLESLGLDGKAKKYPSELSQGQLQRVSVARALINHPTLLIADEPTSSLDDKNAENVMDMLITQAKENSASLVIATHDTRIRNRVEREYLL